MSLSLPLSTTRHGRRQMSTSSVTPSAPERTYPSRCCHSTSLPAPTLRCSSPPLFPQSSLHDMSASRTAIASLRPLVRSRPVSTSLRTIRTLRTTSPVVSATSRPGAVSPLRLLHTSRPSRAEKDSTEAAANANANAGSSAGVGTDASTMKPNGGNGYVAEQDLDEVIVLYVKPPGLVSHRATTSHCSRIRSGPWIVKVQLERRSGAWRRRRCQRRRGEMGPRFEFPEPRARAKLRSRRR